MLFIGFITVFLSTLPVTDFNQRIQFLSHHSWNQKLLFFSSDHVVFELTASLLHCWLKHYLPKLYLADFPLKYQYFFFNGSSNFKQAIHSNSNKITQKHTIATPTFYTRDGVPSIHYSFSPHSLCVIQIKQFNFSLITV